HQNMSLSRPTTLCPFLPSLLPLTKLSKVSYSLHRAQMLPQLYKHTPVPFEHFQRSLRTPLVTLSQQLRGLYLPFLSCLPRPILAILFSLQFPRILQRNSIIINTHRQRAHYPSRPSR